MRSETIKELSIYADDIEEAEPTFDVKLTPKQLNHLHLESTNFNVMIKI